MGMYLVYIFKISLCMYVCMCTYVSIIYLSTLVGIVSVGLVGQYSK